MHVVPENIQLTLPPMDGILIWTLHHQFYENNSVPLLISHLPAI